jgi:hypothetical protein
MEECEVWSVGPSSVQRDIPTVKQALFPPICMIKRSALVNSYDRNSYRSQKCWPSVCSYISKFHSVS